MRKPRVATLKPIEPKTEKPVLPDRFNVCAYGKRPNVTKPESKVY